ncbi:LLM class flavin-dependent oxidoreductase [Streptomyces sp. NBC_00566]|uniref:LLM class flavin-dependent oxidoreductase n=1 Tax=Streptomyces sp. NBC_00566 TaxID=2975778 RepID=UPI002E80575F|nr:LLM class flavin-dependent oxidoreductase [Streptomyces sp. NBC_00566]WUB85877.1 LLM class flavin-dependent oxidoreductase [Streptomyces sp. NBC_00566]
MTRELHLSVALGSAGPRSAAHWTGLVQLAELGALDFVTLDDSLDPADGDGRLDAVAVLAHAAARTSRIGLIPTVTTTHTEPFHTSSALATLDFVSEGRAGWLVDVSTTEEAARATGRRDPAPAPELWAEASDAAEAAARLWDSWEDDAEIRDTATGRFIDRDRLHHVDFEGPRFSVRGPSIVPRPPQGRPPVAVVLDAQASDARWELAARHAEIVLLDADSPAAAREAHTELRRRAGRDDLRVLIRVGLAPGALAGVTETLDALPDLLADWHAEAGTDGFHLVTTTPTEELPAVIHDVVPALRTRGLFRATHTGRTLRDHLGLSRPDSRYAVRTEAAL